MSEWETEVFRVESQGAITTLERATLGDDSEIGPCHISMKLEVHCHQNTRDGQRTTKTYEQNKMLIDARLELATFSVHNGAVKET